MNILWKDIEGYTGFAVSNDGQIRNNKTRRILKQATNHNGYKTVAVRIGGRGGKDVNFRVHVQVAKAFLDKPTDPLKNQVNHIDGDKTNNHVSNLEWSTAKDNIIHAFQTGLHVKLRGADSPNASLTESDVAYIRENYVPYSSEFGGRALARQFGVSHTVISRVVNGKKY